MMTPSTLPRSSSSSRPPLAQTPSERIRRVKHAVSVEVRLGSEVHASGLCDGKVMGYTPQGLNSGGRSHR